MNAAGSAKAMNDSAEQGSQVQRELETIYSNRFSGSEAYRNEVWKILTKQFFSRWIKPGHIVLDLGCGYGEFINNVQAAKKFGMDLNPSTKDLLAKDITLFQQDCSAPWPLPNDSLDIVFTSNFFEHLPTKMHLQETLAEVLRCLKPGGRILALGPNVKYVSGKYWDFFDHHIALTELSLTEAMQMTGFTVDEQIARFLPYSMSQGSQPPLIFLRAFLRMRFAWPLFGRQFLVIGRKASNRTTAAQ